MVLGGKDVYIMFFINRSNYFEQEVFFLLKIL